MIVWSDPAVQSAIIQAVGSILSAVIAAVFASIIGKQFLDRKLLRNKLELAQSDIAFLLCVETLHCEKHHSHTNRSFKSSVRQMATERGFVWSGKFTPGRVKPSLNAD